MTKKILFVSLLLGSIMCKAQSVDPGYISGHKFQPKFS